MRREAAHSRLEAVERRHRRRSAGRRTVGRAPADRGHRQGADLRVAHPGHGRADRGIDRRRRSNGCSRSCARSRGRGVGIVYISHRLEEVPRVADRVTVMRDGQVAGTTCRERRSRSSCSCWSAGRSTSFIRPRGGASAGACCISSTRVSARAASAPAGRRRVDVSLDVHAGEIVGLAGIMGAGRTELLTALYGARARGTWSGTVEIDGAPARLSSIRAARRRGLAFVTDDRRGSGLMLRDGVGRNLVMSVLRRVSPYCLMSKARETRLARQAIGLFDMRPPAGPRSPSARSRAAISRRSCSPRRCWASPRLLLLDEPTRGVDVGAKGEIYARLRDLAATGARASSSPRAKCPS